MRGHQPSTQVGIARLYAYNTAYQWVKDALTPAPVDPPSASSDTIGYLNEVLDCLKLTRKRYQAYADGGTTKDVQSDLASGVPVPIRISWSTNGGGGHFMALIGLDNTSGTSKFVVYDPSETKEDVGHRVIVTEQQLANAYDGIGTWSHIYPVK